MKWFSIGMIFLSLMCVCFSENDTFVPTKEWQEVKPGQSIPPGLHVRIDMTSGKKEAKILEKDNDKTTSDLSVVPEDAEVTKKNFKISKTLSDALKNLPKDTLGLDFDPEKFEKIKKEYKSYDEIKRSLKDVNVNLKTDAEVISELIREYKNVTKEESKQAEITRILENFNYLVHQIDNAIWFIDEGGLESVLLPIIVNNTNTVLKVQSMRVLGALSQNNPKAQIAVYEKNFGSHLSQILISSASTDELSTALYAFGSLLRKFPHAQKNILLRSGMRALVTVISKDCEIKIKAKAMTLISDLITEKSLAVANAAQQDASQYYDLNFDEWLNANEYCQTVDGALLLRLYDLIEQADVMEYIVLALETTASTCQRIWSESAQLRHTLLTVKNRYLHSNEEYRLEVAKLIERLLGMLFKENAGVRDEL